MTLFLLIIKALTATLCAWLAAANWVILTAVHYGKEIMKMFALSLATALSGFGPACAVELEPTPPTALVEPTLRSLDETVRQVNEQVRVLDKNWSQAHKARQLAQAGIAVEPPEPPEDALFNLDVQGAAGAFKDHFFLGSGRASGTPLIVRGGELNPEVQSHLQEDMTVMTRILNKAIGPKERREDGDWAMGIFVTTLGGPRRPQGLYLEGYGALFLGSVKFPLVAPPKREVKDLNESKEHDSEWEQAKQEIYGPREPRRDWSGPVRAEGPKVEYDSDRMGELKKSVLEALKNANNIRHLKPEESITVVITGTGARPATPVRRIYKNTGPGGGPKVRTDRDVVTIHRSDRGVATADETHLTVRVKKADVEAFAKGKMNFEEFEKKASVAAY